MTEKNKKPSFVLLFIGAVLVPGVRVWTLMNLWNH